MLCWYSGGFFTLSLFVCLDLSSGGDTADVLALVTTLSWESLLVFCIGARLDDRWVSWSIRWESCTGF